MTKPITILALGLIVFSSCSKNVTQQTNQAKFKAVQAVEKINNQVEQRMAFNLLTLSEKIELSERHIDFCLNYFTLSQDQKNVLLTAKANLGIYYSSADIETDQKAKSLESDIATYFSNLTEDKRQLIFDSMVTSEDDVANMPVVSPDKVTPCTCSTASNYCGGFGTKCDKDACNQRSTWGCGTLWAYSCSGKCNIFA